MKTLLRVLTAGILLVFAGTVFADSYLVKVKKNSLSRVTSKIEAMGGTVTHHFGQIGYLAVEADANFLDAGASIRGVGAVMPDLVLQ